MHGAFPALFRRDPAFPAGSGPCRIPCLLFRNKSVFSYFGKPVNLPNAAQLSLLSR
jgi:hypothetical protein